MKGNSQRSKLFHLRHKYCAEQMGAARVDCCKPSPRTAPESRHENRYPRAPMTGWLIEHHAVIASYAGVGTLAIWGVYLHLLLQSHRRQRKPMLLISKDGSEGLSARCMVTNMSQEAVYIESVVVELRCGSDCTTAYITEAEDIRTAGNPIGWEKLTRQGPLKSGTMTDMGTFDCILDYLARSSDAGPVFLGSALAEDPHSCDISILGFYGSEDLLIGATRRFVFDGSGAELTLKTASVDTRQIASQRERRRLSRQLARKM